MFCLYSESMFCITHTHTDNETRTFKCIVLYWKRKVTANIASDWMNKRNRCEEKENKTKQKLTQSMKTVSCIYIYIYRVYELVWKSIVVLQMNFHYGHRWFICIYTYYTYVKRLSRYTSIFSFLLFHKLKNLTKSISIGQHFEIV